MLPKNQRQEALSRAYVQAVAAHSGLMCSPREPDYGIDLTLYHIRYRNGRYGESGFRLDLQLKSTTGSGVTDNEILYDLEVKTYEDLREPTVTVHRILVLMVLPEDESRWTSHSEEQLSIRDCAYWLSLRGRPPTMNKRTVQVALPRVNVFSVEGVTGLMDRIRGGEEL
jgi:hypothetical protein